MAGYRGMGPVRIGNLAYRRVQHDVYGSVILAATHIFFDQRLTRRGDEALSIALKRPASKSGAATTSPMPAFGNCAAVRACIPFRR